MSKSFFASDIILVTGTRALRRCRSRKVGFNGRSFFQVCFQRGHKQGATRFYANRQSGGMGLFGDPTWQTLLLNGSKIKHSSAVHLYWSINRFHSNRCQQSKSCANSNASIRTSTSALVLYSPKDARQVAVSPKCSINGPVQCWPARTATPFLSKMVEMS